jgi:hypothetical protein
MQEATKPHQVNPAILEQIRSMLLSTRVVYKDGQLVRVLVDSVAVCDEADGDCGEQLCLKPGYFKLTAHGEDNYGRVINLHTIIDANALECKYTIDWVESDNTRRSVVIWNDVAGAYVIADENVRPDIEYSYATTQISSTDFSKLVEQFPMMFDIRKNRVTYTV